MPAGVVVAQMVFAGVMLVIAGFAGRAQHRKRVALLKAVAERRGGGTVSESGKLLLTVKAGDVRVEVTVWSTKHGSFTEYWAHLPAPGMVWFKVGPADFGGWVGKMFGAQDVSIGDIAFDDGFIVKALDERAVRSVWELPRARMMLRQFEKTRIESDGGVVHMTEPRIGGPDDINRGIEFLLDVSTADPYGLAALRALPEAVMRDGARFPYAQLPGPQPILIGPIEEHHIARTWARTTAIGRADGDLPPAATALLAVLGRDVVMSTTEHETRVVWSGIETDPGRLMAAVELLRVLGSAPSLGVFR